MDIVKNGIDTLFAGDTIALEGYVCEKNWQLLDCGSLSGRDGRLWRWC